MTSFEYPWALKRLFAGLSLSLALGACQEKTPATDDNAPVPLVAPKPADASDAGEIPADPNDAESLYFAGQQEFLNGNFAKAAEHFRSVILMEKKPEDMRDTLELLLGDASAAFEKLPLIQDEAILRNILYSGVWQGYNEYLHKKDKKMNKESEVEGHGE